MTHPKRARGYIEAVLVATAIVRRDIGMRILREVDRDSLSPSAFALLSQLLAPAEDRRIDGVMFPDSDTVYPQTKAQEALADRVNAVTIADLCFWETETLIALANQLPERAPRLRVWEQALAVATGSGP